MHPAKANQHLNGAALGIPQQTKSSSQECAACRSDQGVVGEEHEPEGYAADTPRRRIRYQGERAYARQSEEQMVAASSKRYERRSSRFTRVQRNTHGHAGARTGYFGKMRNRQ